MKATRSGTHRQSLAVFHPLAAALLCALSMHAARVGAHEFARPSTWPTDQAPTDHEPVPVTGNPEPAGRLPIDWYPRRGEVMRPDRTQCID